MSGEKRNAEDSRRADRWLWFARFFKSRSAATRYCLSGKLRVNSVPVAKSHHALKIGDVLTFVSGGRVRVVRVLALGMRRGPAPEARALYLDLDPPKGETRESAPVSMRAPGSGRPTKAERRALDRLRGREGF